VNRLREVAAVFTRLGLFGFGGPAAHLGMMEADLVERRGWITREHFLDIAGAVNLIPGPNSTEMVIHLGWLRAGWRGMLVAGICFLAPAVLLTGLLGWLYVNYGALPSVQAFIWGIQPAVWALILAAGWRLARTAITGVRQAILAAVVIAAVLLGLNEVLALLLGIALGVLVLAPRPRDTAREGASLLFLFLFFLKVGAVLYGTGYVLVAFLEGDLVEAHGLLTRQQLLDAIAAGQLTPGPILSTATFIGYLLHGWAGAVVGTVAIFLPSFVLVAIFGPLLSRLRQSPRAELFLAAVRVAAVALIAAVLLKLGKETLLDWRAALIALLAAVAAIRFKAGAVPLVCGGALLGWVLA